MSRAELERLKAGDRVHIDYGVGTVIRVDLDKDLVVVSYGGQAWFRGREMVSLPSRGGFGIEIRGGS